MYLVSVDGGARELKWWVPTDLGAKLITTSCWGCEGECGLEVGLGDDSSSLGGYAL